MRKRKLFRRMEDLFIIMSVLIGGLAMIIMTLDLIGFGLWIYYGHTPIDGFYFGRITTEIIKLFL